MAKKKMYRALTGLSFPVTSAAVKKRKAGKELAPDEWARVEANETTDAIPAESVPWLLKGGEIEEVTDG